MSALRKYVEVAEHVEARESWTPVVIVSGKEVPAATEAEKPRMLRNMALFLSAPFIGLLYAVLLPFVGLGMLAWFAGKALMAEPKAREAARFAVFCLKMVAAPWIALAYLIALPFMAVAMIASIGVKAVVASPAS